MPTPSHREKTPLLLGVIPTIWGIAGVITGNLQNFAFLGIDGALMLAGLIAMGFMVGTVVWYKLR